MYPKHHLLFRFSPTVLHHLSYWSWFPASSRMIQELESCFRTEQMVPPYSGQDCPFLHNGSDITVHYQIETRKKICSLVLYQVQCQAKLRHYPHLFWPSSKVSIFWWTNNPGPQNGHHMLSEWNLNKGVWSAMENQALLGKTKEVFQQRETDEMRTNWESDDLFSFLELKIWTWITYGYNFLLPYLVYKGKIVSTVYL